MRIQVNSRKLARPRVAARPKVAKRSPVQRELKTKLAAPIDSKGNPSWFLEDPTLRRGDVIVLKGRVLVYEGRRGRNMSLADFALLRDSRLVSKGERTRIEGMARVPAATPMAAASKPVASVEPAPVNVELTGRPTEPLLETAQVRQISLTATQ